MKTKKSVTSLENEDIDNLVLLGMIAQMSRLLNDIKKKTGNSDEEVFSLVAGYAAHLTRKENS